MYGALRLVTFPVWALLIFNGCSSHNTQPHDNNATTPPEDSNPLAAKLDAERAKRDKLLADSKSIWMYSKFVNPIVKTELGLSPSLSKSLPSQLVNVLSAIPPSRRSLALACLHLARDEDRAALWHFQELKQNDLMPTEQKLACIAEAYTCWKQGWIALAAENFVKAQKIQAPSTDSGQMPVGQGSPDTQATKIHEQFVHSLDTLAVLGASHAFIDLGMELQSRTVLSEYKVVGQDAEPALTYLLQGYMHQQAGHPGLASAALARSAETLKESDEPEKQVLREALMLQSERLKQEDEGAIAIIADLKLWKGLAYLICRSALENPQLTNEMKSAVEKLRTLPEHLPKVEREIK